MNIEVTLEMGLTTFVGASSASNSLYQTIKLDKSNYDGVAGAYFEIVYSNSDTSPHTAYLRYGTTDVATVTLAASQTNTLYTTSLTWSNLPSGDTIYVTRLGASTANCKIHAARIIIVQTNPTKTRIQIPLWADDAAATTAAPATTTSASDTQSGNAQNWAHFKYTAANLVTIPSSGIDIEAVLKSSNSTATAYCTLYNATDTAAVTGASCSVTGTTLTIARASFSSNATNFHDGDEFEVKIKSSSSSRTATMGFACLYIKLDTVTRFEIYQMYSRPRSVTTDTISSYQKSMSRMDTEVSITGEIACKNEVSGYCTSSAQNSVYIYSGYDGRLSDSGVTLPTSNGTSFRARSPAIDVNTTGVDYSADLDYGSATIYMGIAFLLYDNDVILVKSVTDSGSGSDTVGFPSKQNLIADNIQTQKYLKTYTITGSSSGSISNYVMEVVVSYEAGKTTNDFGNVRFYVGETSCPYFIKQKTDGTSATFGVKIPTIPASPGTVSLNLVLVGDTTTTSSIVNTYHWADDFTGALTEKWEYIGSGYSVSNGNLVSTATDADLQSYPFTALTNFKIETIFNENTTSHTFRFGAGNTSCNFIYMNSANLFQFIKCGETTCCNVNTTISTGVDHRLSYARYNNINYGYYDGSLKIQSNDSFYTEDVTTAKIHDEGTSHTHYYRYVAISPFIYPEPTIDAGGSWTPYLPDAITIGSTVSKTDSASGTDAITVNQDRVRNEDIGQGTDYSYQTTKISVQDSSIGYVQVPITSTDSLTNYVVELDLYVTSGTGIDCTGIADSNFDYLQPKDSPNGSLLPFAKSVSGNQAVFDIKIPSLSSGTNYIYLVRTASQTSPDTLDDIYIFADDFIGSNGSAPNASKWTRTEGTPTIQNNTMRILAGEQIKSISISNPHLMVRYKMYWQAFGANGPRFWSPIKWNSGETSNGCLYIEEGRPGGSDTWNHTAVNCGSFTTHHYVWNTGQWYNFTGRTSSNTIYFDVPDGYTISQSCTVDDHAALVFDTWDSGNDLRIDYVKAQPFVANIPTIGTSTIVPTIEIIDSWMGATIPDIGSGVDTTTIDLGSTPVNIGDTGALLTEILGLKNSLTQSDSGTGVDNQGISKSFTLTDQNGTTLDIITLHVILPQEKDDAFSNDLGPFILRGIIVTDSKTGLTETIYAKNSFTQTDTGHGTDSTPSIKNSFTITDNDGTPVETITLKNSFSIPETGSGADSTAFKGILSQSDSGSGADSYNIKVNLSFSDLNSVVTELISMKNSFSQTDSGSGLDVTDVESYILTTDHNGVTSEIPSLKISFLTTDQNGVTTETILRNKAITITDLDTLIVELVGLLISLSQSETGSGLDNIGLMNASSQSDSGSGLDNLTIKNSFSQGDGGSGTDNVALKNFLPQTDSGSGAETPSIKTALLQSDIGSGLDSILRNVLTTEISLSDSGSSTGETVAIKNSLLIGDLSGTVLEILQIDSIIPQSETGSGTETYYIKNSFLITDLNTGRTETLEIKNKFTQTDTGSGVDTTASKNMVHYTDQNGTITEIVSLRNTFAITDINGIPVETIHAGAGVVTSDIGSGADTITSKPGLQITDLNGAITELTNLKNSLSQTDTGSGVDVASPKNIILYADQNGTITELPSIKVSHLETDSGSSVDITEVYVGLNIGDLNSIITELVNIKTSLLQRELSGNLLPIEYSQMNNVLSWEIAWSAGGDTCERSTDYVKEGQYSFKFQWNHVGGIYSDGGFVHNGGATILPGETRTFKIWTYAPETFTVVLALTGTHGYINREITVEPTWKQETFTITNNYGVNTWTSFYMWAPSATKVMYVDVAECFDVDNSGAMESTILINRLGTTDSGSGVDATPNVKTAISAIDSGSITETITTAHSLIQTDLGSGLDVISSKVSFQITDVNSVVTELLGLKNSLNISETGSGIDTATMKGIVLYTDQNGVVTELPSIKVGFVVVDQNGAITETPSIKNYIIITDINLLLESVMASARIDISDLNLTVTELVALKNSLLQSDSGSGVDVIAPKNMVYYTDQNGAITEIIALRNVFQVTDTSSLYAEEIVQKIRTQINETGSLYSETILTKNSFKITDLNGTITELINLRNSLTQSDSGSGADTASPKNIILYTDQNGVITELPTIKVSFSQVDSGHGNEENPVILAKINITDIDTLLTELINIKNSLSQSDTLYGVDIVTLKNSFTQTDSGSGLDLQTLKAQIQITDTGSEVDSIQTNIALRILENGYGVDAASRPGSFVAISDMGLLTQEVLTRTILLFPVNITDTSTGEDVLIDIKNRFLVSDTSTGNDIILAGAGTIVTDSGIGDETTEIYADITTTDTSSGTEIIGIQAMLSLTDSGAETDTITVLAKIPVTDYQNLVDEIGVNVALHISQTAQSDDTVSILVSLTVEDVANSIDSITRFVSASGVNISDLGSAIDLINTSTKLAVSDNSFANDLINIFIRLGIIESGSSNETINISTRNQLADLIHSVEQMGIKVNFTIIESGNSLDTISALEKLIMGEIGTGNDTQSLLKKIHAIDNGYGVDTTTIKAYLSLTDLFLGTDSIQATREDILEEDIGIGEDPARAIKGFFIGDTIDYNENIGLSMFARIIEYPHITETIAIDAELIVEDLITSEDFVIFVGDVVEIDTGAGEDTIEVTTKNIISDYGELEELIDLLISIREEDEGTGIDELLRILYLYYFTVRVEIRKMLQGEITVQEAFTVIAETKKSYDINIQDIRRKYEEGE